MTNDSKRGMRSGFALIVHRAAEARYALGDIVEKRLKLSCLHARDFEDAEHLIHDAYEDLSLAIIQADEVRLDCIGFARRIRMKKPRVPIVFVCPRTIEGEDIEKLRIVSPNIWRESMRLDVDGFRSVALDALGHID